MLEYYMSLDYPVEVRRIPNTLGGGYSASIPHLGRMAFFAEGDTVDEAIAELDNVKCQLFQHMLDKGKDIPVPPPLPEDESDQYSGRLLLRLPRDLHRELALRSQDNGCSINQYAATALAKQLGGEMCAETTAVKALQQLSCKITEVHTSQEVYSIRTEPSGSLVSPGAIEKYKTYEFGRLLQ